MKERKGMTKILKEVRKKKELQMEKKERTKETRRGNKIENKIYSLTKCNSHVYTQFVVNRNAQLHAHTLSWVCMYVCMSHKGPLIELEI